MVELEQSARPANVVKALTAAGQWDTTETLVRGVLADQCKRPGSAQEAVLPSNSV